MIDVFGNIRNPVHEVMFSIFDAIYIYTLIHHNPSAGDKFEVDGIAGDVGGWGRSQSAGSWVWVFHSQSNFCFGWQCVSMICFYDNGDFSPIYIIGMIRLSACQWRFIYSQVGCHTVPHSGVALRLCNRNKLASNEIVESSVKVDAWGSTRKSVSTVGCGVLTHSTCSRCRLNISVRFGCRVESTWSCCVFWAEDVPVVLLQSGKWLVAGCWWHMSQRQNSRK